MALQLRECRPNELRSVTERLDQEFVFSKKRSLSLCHRFPNTLSAANISQIRVAVLDGVIHGVLTLRMFDWVSNQQIWHGAMIGMVWVNPEHRGTGVGCELLSSARQVMEEAEIDFGVLWTGAPAFYERAGWFSSDRGIFGTTTISSTFACRDIVVSRLPVASVDSTWLERLRASGLAMRVIRDSIDYCTVPLPAERVLCFRAVSNTAEQGFALIGEKDGIGYLYELVAPRALWEPLWSAATGHFKRLFVNGQAGDSCAQWLAENRLVEWEPQNKAMWLRVSEQLDERTIGSWHIPYFDWI
jgi:predicted N-acetyltransferase YhbS